MEEQRTRTLTVFSSFGEYHLAAHVGQSARAIDQDPDDHRRERTRIAVEYRLSRTDEIQCLRRTAKHGAPRFDSYTARTKSNIDIEGQHWPES